MAPRDDARPSPTIAEQIAGAARQLARENARRISCTRAEQSDYAQPSGQLDQAPPRDPAKEQRLELFRSIKDMNYDSS
jgi:hypothetical protein